MMMDSCCRHFSGGVICGGNETETPWKPAADLTLVHKDGSSEPMPEAHRLPTQCCNRLETAENTEQRYVTAFGGYVGNHQIRCREGRGCNAHPPYRRTAHLREGWYVLDG